VERLPAGLGRTLALANAARVAEGERRASLFVEALLACTDRLPTARDAEELERRLEARLGHPSRRLAAYGTLRPGEANHALLVHVGGAWRAGVVRGRLHPEGWGLTQGFPALVPDARGERIPVDVLESAELCASWPRLDAFEGQDYARVLVEVELEAGARVVANLYALRRSC